jgi:hypothetical protein
MCRVLASTFLSSTLLLVSCVAPSEPEATKAAPKSTEWLCSISFDFGEEIPAAFLGTGKTREAALKEARADCARRRMETSERATCLSAVAAAERCSAPD